MAVGVEFLIAFLVAFGLNLIPFFGPSNLLVASTAAIGLVNPDFSALILLAFLIALAAALAKGIHYMLTFFVSEHLSEKNRKKLILKLPKLSVGLFFFYIWQRQLQFQMNPSLSLLDF